jgi:pSer/pThr/pTyr-binding forkhead associated (FHA) protein
MPDRIGGGGAGLAASRLGRPPLTLGRVPHCGLILPDHEVSRRHCQIEVRGEQAVRTDLDSTNGAFVDGQRIGGPDRLLPGARITIGASTLSSEWSDAMADVEATGTARPGRFGPRGLLAARWME